MNQNIYTIKGDESTIEFTDLFKTSKRKKIHFSVEIMPWELKRDILSC